MSILRKSRRFGWPDVGLYGGRSRGDIKLLSVQELERITAVASANQKWSANGRPEWLKERRNHIDSLMMTIFGMEGDLFVGVW